MTRILNYLKPYWYLITAALVLVFFQSMAELYLPTLMADIVDTGIVNGDVNYIISVGIKMLLVALGGAFSAVMATFFSSRASMGLGKTLREEIFKHVEGFSINEFDSFGAASLITRTTNDVTQIQMVTMMSLRMVATAPIMAIGGIIMALSRAPSISWIFLVVIPVIALVMVIVSRISVPLFGSIQKKIDTLNRVLRENLTGVRVIRAFNRVDYENKRFNKANLDLTNTAIRVNRLMAGLMPIIMFIFNMTTIAIIWFGSVRIDRGIIQVGDLMAFIQYATLIMSSVMMISMIFIMYPRASASAERINEVLDTTPEIIDPVRPQIPAEIKGVVEFRDVTFRYPGAEEPVLSNITFGAEPGKTTAIIGSTGAGKTTLLNLIMRFYDAEKGSILIDGVDIREIPQDVLRSNIGYVPQRSTLFTGTIADNIRYGKDDATDDEVRHAASIAQALDFIEEMDDKFDTIISEGGTNVSGGQKQRLCIARAIIRRPKIYIFDDSFSALDFKTDARLRHALHKETKNATVIMVAQRVATIMDADQIVVLDEGRIVGIGTHKELYKNCDVYRDIVLSQLSEEEVVL
ncbi:MAG: ABC transporter ATP-binding protein [Thermoanaerobacteraceae bacterium]|nr:ABC transporter ATP-binding protein [Thermoanaerobacteraceae bacterium]